MYGNFPNSKSVHVHYVYTVLLKETQKQLYYNIGPRSDIQIKNTKQPHCNRYVAEILPTRCKTLSINQLNTEIQHNIKRHNH